MANLYETLGVTPKASQDDIRKAYRKAAKETHPDLNPGDKAAEALDELVRLFETNFDDPVTDVG